MSTPDFPAHGRTVCRAVAEATGIRRIRTAEVSAAFNDVTVFKVEFIATDAQAKAFGEALARIVTEAHTPATTP